MPMSTYEKALRKQQKEAERLAEQEERRQRAVAIVNGQPIVGGLRIMDASAEELFRVILDCYDGNKNRAVSGSCDVIPRAYEHSLRLEFEKLCMYGVVTSPHGSIAHGRCI